MCHLKIMYHFVLKYPSFSKGAFHLYLASLLAIYNSLYKDDDLACLFFISFIHPPPYLARCPLSLWQMEQSPGRGSGLHIRLLCLLTLLYAMDTAMVLYAVDKTVKDGPSVHTLFACEVCRVVIRWVCFLICASSYTIACFLLLVLYRALND